MRVAQKGVQAFVGHAIAARVPFAMETVFSYWEAEADGRIASKIDLITDLQAIGYFVLLVFVGLANAEASILRVISRVQQGGHGINEATLRRRFPKTQKAIAAALKVADVSLLVDNSRSADEAFAVCRAQIGLMPLFDARRGDRKPPAVISAWLDVVAPD